MKLLDLGGIFVLICFGIRGHPLNFFSHCKFRTPFITFSSHWFLIHWFLIALFACAAQELKRREEAAARGMFSWFILSD